MFKLWNMTNYQIYSNYLKQYYDSLFCTFEVMSLPSFLLKPEKPVKGSLQFSLSFFLQNCQTSTIQILFARIWEKKKQKKHTHTTSFFLFLLHALPVHVEFRGLLPDSYVLFNGGPEGGGIPNTNTKGIVIKVLCLVGVRRLVVPLEEWQEWHW